MIEDIIDAALTFIYSLFLIVVLVFGFAVMTIGIFYTVAHIIPLILGI